MSKVIMYHYVRNYSSKLPYFNFLHKKSFYKQLKFLKRKFNFFVLNDNLHKLRYSKKILLTFDDGLKEHLNIAKFLKKENILGIFFISSYPLI